MSALLSFLGWSFLPSVSSLTASDFSSNRLIQMVTGWLLAFYYRFITRAGDPIPQRGSPRYIRDYKRIHVSVITLYLLYTIYEAYYTLTVTPNFYTLLVTPLNADEKTLKSRFRRLTVLYHPDKVGTAGEGYFVTLKQAYDVLSDPVKRFAYDRFGPEVMEWRHCNTVYDYLVRGGATMVPYYIGTLGLLIILSVLGKAEFGRYVYFPPLASPQPKNMLTHQHNSGASSPSPPSSFSKLLSSHAHTQSPSHSSTHSSHSNSSSSLAKSPSRPSSPSPNSDQ